MIRRKKYGILKTTERKKEEIALKLRFDNTKTYAIALEGGGARGAYEVGVWQALDEAGVHYNAVAGTSVGALNGAMMCMRDLERAKQVWGDIRLSQVIALDDQDEELMQKVLSGQMAATFLHKMLPKLFRVIIKGGLDVTPLRRWIGEVVDADAVKASDVTLFVTTLSLSDFKGLEIRVNDLPTEDVCDMLLASAYHPTFRHEKLGGKMYTDGGFFDSLPIHVLVENGYKDIIAVRLPGIAVNRRFTIPDDVTVTTVCPKQKLGSVLNFDKEQSRPNMLLGYLDTMRMLYGLAGSTYYLDCELTEREAVDGIIEQAAIEAPGKAGDLSGFFERRLPALRRRLGVRNTSYRALYIAWMENRAKKAGVPNDRIYTMSELIAATLERELAVPDALDRAFEQAAELAATDTKKKAE